jgi:hypothetical protein
MCRSVRAAAGSPAVTRGEREHLPPSEPDKADTYGCDAGAVVDRR